MISEVERQRIARRYLERYRGTNENLKSLEESAKRTMEIATRTTSPPDKMVVDSTHNPHKFDEVLADNLNSIEEQRLNLLQIQREIIITIGKVESNIYQTILREKYLNDKRFDVIAERLGYTPEWVKELNARALLEVYELIKEPTRVYCNRTYHKQ